MNIIDLQNLVPGSQWLTSNGHVHTFMFHTNEALPEKLKAKFPSVLVYVDENGNILSTRTEAFLKRRTFHDVDDRRAQLIDSLVFNTDLPVQLVDNSLQQEEDQNEDRATSGMGIQIVEDDDESLSGTDEDGDLEEEQYSDSTDRPMTKILFYSERSDYEDGMPLEVTEDQLRRAFVSYESGPGFSQQLEQQVIKHKFMFRNDELTNQQLTDAFNQTRQTYFSEFEVDGSQITWDTFLGVYQTTDNYASAGIAVFETVLTHDDHQDQQGDQIPSVDIEPAPAAQPLIDPQALTQMSNMNFMNTAQAQNKTVPLTPEQVQAIQEKQTGN